MSCRGQPPVLAQQSCPLLTQVVWGGGRPSLAPTFGRVSEQSRLDQQGLGSTELSCPAQAGYSVPALLSRSLGRQN